MSTRRSSSSTLAVKAAEIAFAAPQVIAHRLTRMAQSGHAPSAADKRELMQMSSEKLDAFNEGWRAIGMEMVRIQQRSALAMLSSLWSPWSAGARTNWLPTTAQAQKASLALLGVAIAPVHRRAVANAKRLGRSPRR